MLHLIRILLQENTATSLLIGHWSELLQWKATEDERISTQEIIMADYVSSNEKCMAIFLSLIL